MTQKANSAATRKAKGRRLQQWVRDLIIEVFGLPEDDVKSTSMGASGEDVQLSDRARTAFPFSVECKNKERINVWEEYKQAQSNCGEYEPILVISRNRHKPLVVVDAEYFIRRKHEKV